MKRTRNYLLFWFLMVSLVSNTQEITNIHFEQVGKQIHIYYDLQGDQTYTVQVFCSTDNDKTWGQPLKYVTGAVGETQKPENSKMIAWDVLAEREKLSGEIRFKIEIINAGTFIDTRDGQTCKWVKIGEQVWMAENLNFKTNSGSWVYDNDSKNAVTYGRLYDWSTARRSCPNGWHLPTDDEWKTLEMYLGMSQHGATGYRGTDEGEKLKSTNDWYHYAKGIDTVGFNALPGGYRSTNGNFDYLGDYGAWWSATKTKFSSKHNALYRDLGYGTNKVGRNGGSKGNGFSVRCVRD